MVSTDRFRILGTLGRGGMGTVYRATDVVHGGREVALKTYQPSQRFTAEELLRFKEEFRAMTRLRHPNTIEVFDYGLLDDERPFFTMEIVTGQDLADRIGPHGMPLGEVYTTLLQILQALEFIHARGYVHRDIKPQNIRVRDDGRVKLMDFGIMEPIGSAADHEIAGTISYMPPEVLQAGTVDATSDLYSVGCMAFEMVTGRPPFIGTAMQVLTAHSFVEPAPLRQLRRDAPARLESLVARLIAKRQADRHQDASEVIADVAALAGITVVKQSIEQKRSYLVTSSLVGREQELSRLHAAWTNVTSGQCRTIFIGGMAGVGKSRLAHELVMHAKLEAATIVPVRCVESGMAPYQALERLLGAPLPAAAAGVDPATEKAKIAEAIMGWLSSKSEGAPVLVFLDDLQWCDAQSFEVLSRCFREMEGARVLFLGTLRTDEMPAGSALWLATRDAKSDNISLGTLDFGQVRLLLESMLRRVQISDDAVRTLYEATSGNAFFVTEVLRYLVEQGELSQTDGVWSFPYAPTRRGLPTSVEGTVLRRLARLGRGALDVARVASVLGRYPDLDALLAVGGLGEDALFEHLDELLERQFLTREARRCAFLHDRVREVLYDDIPEDLRRDLHQRYAEYLESRQTAHAKASELAHHYSRGRNRKKAYEYLRRAGDESKTTGMEGVALEYWRSAVEALGKVDLPGKETELFELHSLIAENGIVVWPEVGLASAETCAQMLEAEGNIDAICALMRRFVALVRRLPAPLRDRLLAEMARPVPYTHRPRAGLARLVPPSPPSWVPKYIESLVLTCVCAGMAGQPRRGLPAGRRALALLPFLDSPLEGATITAIGGCLQAAGHIDELRTAIARARELLFHRDLGGQDFLMSARIGAAGFSNFTVFQGERFDPAFVEYGEQAIEVLRKPDFLNQLWAYPAIWFTWTGRSREARELCAKIMENCRNIGAPPFPWEIYVRAHSAWQRGAYADARVIVDEALELPHVARMMVARESLCVVRGMILAAMGENSEARAELDALEQRARAAGMDLVRIQALLGLGYAAFLERDFGEARERCRGASELSTRGPSRNPLHEAIAARMLGEIDVVEGDFPTAARRFDDAMAIVTSPSQDNLYEQALLHRARGDMERARGDVVSARGHYVNAKAGLVALDNRHSARSIDERLERIDDDSAKFLPIAEAMSAPALAAAETEVVQLPFRVTENLDPAASIERGKS